VLLLSTKTMADSGDMIGALFNIAQGFTYIITIISWILLFSIISADKRKLIIVILFISIISCLFGIKSIDFGRDFLEDANYKEDGESFIIWGWTIIILNILPIVITLVVSVIRNQKESIASSEEDEKNNF